MAEWTQTRHHLQWMTLSHGGVIRCADVVYLAPQRNDFPDKEWVLFIETRDDPIIVPAAEGREIVAAMAKLRSP